MAEARRLLIAEEKKKGAARLAPSDARGLAPFLIAGGLALAIAGWTDLALFYYPTQFGSREWEFGTIARTFDAMPLPTLGLLLIVVGLRARGSRASLVRAMAVVLGVVAVGCLIALVLFSLDIPLVLQTLRRIRATTQANPANAAGLERAIAKTILFSLVYLALYSWMAARLWRTGTRAAPEKP